MTVNSPTVIIYMSFTFVYFFDMFWIVLSGDSLRDLWNVYMNVCKAVKIRNMYLPSQKH